jgi:hypothetical protein
VNKTQLRLDFKKSGRRRPDLIRETGLIPFAAAQSVIEETSRFLGVPLPRRFAVRLSTQAILIYANSVSFRQKLRRPGERGRDMLYLFMRHWLAARLHSERPDLLARLPASYATGTPLVHSPAPPNAITKPVPPSAPRAEPPRRRATRSENPGPCGARSRRSS